MVLRDSFIAHEMTRIVMLTCINPGMRAANHTLNSLRYAERLKDNRQGQGGSGASANKKIPQDALYEDLRHFLEKHGKTFEDREQERNTKLSKVFYQDEMLDEDMADDDQDDLLLESPIEDDIAMIEQPRPVKTHSKVAYQKQNNFTSDGGQKRNL